MVEPSGGPTKEAKKVTTRSGTHFPPWEFIPLLGMFLRGQVSAYPVNYWSAHTEGGCPGAICETQKRGSKRAHVESFRWRPLAPPTIPGARGCWTRLGHRWVTCGAHTTALLLRAGLFVDYLCSGDCPLRPERGPYLPKQTSWPGAPGSGHTDLPLKPNMIRKE